MKMRLRLAWIVMIAFALPISGLPAFSAAESASGFDTGTIPAPHILLPDGEIAATVVLISDAKGWGKAEDSEAQRLAASGAVVIGIDFPSYIAALRKVEGDCVYTVSDIESLSQQIQRKAGNADYKLPIVAGIGEGAAMALAIAAQSPAATFSGTIVVDPLAGIPLTKQFCTPAQKQIVTDRMIYAMTEGPLPDPVTVALSPNADAAGRDHVMALRTAHPDIAVSESDDDPNSALSQMLDDAIAAGKASESPLGLPIEILSAKPALKTMAIIYSGDGGWRDLDKEIGLSLQAQGIPVVGVDSLRYFWSKRTPEETAADLAKMVAFYRKSWNVDHVLLIGYSFGADILAATYNLLSDADKERVAQISLLALSHQVDYEISVMGWLGQSASSGSGDPVDDLAKVDPKKIQCVYGTDEDQDACTALKTMGADVIPIDGGHHFDGDYPALAARIIAGLKQRLQ